jgi:hypothetical protein
MLVEHQPRQKRSIMSNRMYHCVMTVTARDGVTATFANIFEPNEETTRSEVYRDIRAFMAGNLNETVDGVTVMFFSLEPDAL